MCVRLCNSTQHSSSISSRGLNAHQQQLHAPPPAFCSSSQCTAPRCFDASVGNGLLLFFPCKGTAALATIACSASCFLQQQSVYCSGSTAPRCFAASAVNGLPLLFHCYYYTLLYSSSTQCTAPAAAKLRAALLLLLETVCRCCWERNAEHNMCSTSHFLH